MVKIPFKIRFGGWLETIGFTIRVFRLKTAFKMILRSLFVKITDFPPSIETWEVIKGFKRSGTF